MRLSIGLVVLSVFLAIIGALCIPVAVAEDGGGTPINNAPGNVMPQGNPTNNNPAVDLMNFIIGLEQSITNNRVDYIDLPNIGEPPRVQGDLIIDAGGITITHGSDGPVIYYPAPDNGRTMAVPRRIDGTHYMPANNPE